MKRVLLTISILLILLSIFSGCEINKPNNASSYTDERSAVLPAVKTKLTLLFYYEGQERYSVIDNFCNHRILLFLINRIKLI